MAREILTVRIEEKIKAALEHASDHKQDAFAPSKTRIIERGIELALKELESKRRK